jgi:hypothetical protein
VTEPNSSDADDYRDGPPPRPWSREAVFLAVAGLCSAAYFAFVIACQVLIGPSGK